MLALSLAGVPAASSHGTQSSAIYFWVFPGAMQKLKIRPSHITFAADGNYTVTHLKWRRWGAKVARARGIDHIDDCQPNCAAGHVYAVTARVTLSHPGRFKGHRVYRCYNLLASGGPKSQRRIHLCL
jgi:hypothetical protein